MLGFMTDLRCKTLSTHLDIRADYNMSITQLYRQVALDSIYKYKNLEVLLYASHSAHFYPGWPSWIPKWDIAEKWPLSPNYLYNAAGATKPAVQFYPDVDGLAIKGLNLGPIMIVSSFLDFRDFAATSHLGHACVKDTLMDIWRIITQDHWRDGISDEWPTQRLDSNPQHFSDFTAYVLSMLQRMKRDCYLPLNHVWCSVCDQYIQNQNEPTTKLPEGYSCGLCDDFDLCAGCYRSGKNCGNFHHEQRKRKVPSLWIPYSKQLISALEELGRNGDMKQVLDTIKVTNTKHAYFHTSQGFNAVGSDFVEPGDQLVVFFGSRMPFVIRKLGTCYRLISECYVSNFMNGEAIEMWERNELKEQTVEIR
jgi:hypothetical protein